MKHYRKHLSRLLAGLLLAVLVLLPFAPADAAVNNAVRDVRSSVVRVYTLYQIRYQGYDYYMAVSGTGFCVGQAGGSVEYIVTNRHVTETDYSYQQYWAEDPIMVVLADGEVYEVSEVHQSDSYDLSVIRVTSPITSRKPITLGSADDVDVTDEVFALGFPDISEVTDDDAPGSGIDDITVTPGSVSRNHVTVDGADHVQTNADISSGNSGGPLVNDKGYVVGVNTWVQMSQTGAKAGYALDIKYVKEMLDRLNIPYMTPGNMYGGGSQQHGGGNTQASASGSGLLIGLIIGGAVLLIGGIVAALTLSKPKERAAVAAVAPRGAEIAPAQAYAAPVVPAAPAVPQAPVASAPPAAPADYTMPAESGGKIHVLAGSMAGADIPIRDGETLWIGKDARSCNVVFDPSFTHISRMHCSVTYNAKYDMYVVVDESTNGTYLANGTRLQRHERQTVAAGTVLRLANDGKCVRLG